MAHRIIKRLYATYLVRKNQGINISCFTERRSLRQAQGTLSNAVDIGNSERIRSAKIIFLRLRKSIFRTPEKIPEDPLTLNSAALSLWENAVDIGNSERIRSAKIIFLRLRKSIFRTPEKIPEDPLTLNSAAACGR
ncbi:hypothetical protein [Desulfonema magnum]|uniref:hypothetical protein n=1 Tax=Desulfonema magnum TaxID=45655 RepID=UPI001A9B70BA|nr:hypothetical protein [Desulfonema magnum]